MRLRKRRTDAKKRRPHKPEFKAKVALTAIAGELTMAEMLKKFDVHANQIAEWKKQLLSSAPDIFGKSVERTEKSEELIANLHAKSDRLRWRMIF